MTAVDVITVAGCAMFLGVLLARWVIGGVLFPLNGRTTNPLRDRPDVVCQASGHRWRSLPPLSLPLLAAELLPQRPHRLAEVAAEGHEMRHRLMEVPVLAEPVGLANLPRIAVPVGAVVPLDMHRRHSAAHRRVRQGLRQLLWRAVDQPL